MSKEKNFREFCIYLFYGITAVQIVFAVIWLCLNITGYREEFISNNYIKAATTLKVDDYMGILYALIVKFLGHSTVLYIFQILVVLIAVYSLPIQSKAMRCVLGLNVITNPFILQSECTVRPEILLFAGMIALMTAVIKGRMILLCLFTIIMILLNSDYIFACTSILIPMTLYFLIKKEKAKAAILALGLVASWGTGIIVNYAVTDVYAYGNVEKSFDFLCMQRFAGGDVSISGDMVEAFAGVDMKYEMEQSDKVYEELSLLFGSHLENKVGKENAEEIYRAIYWKARFKGAGYYAPSIIRDVSYYLFAPVSVGYVLVNKFPGTSIFNPVRYFVKDMYELFDVYLLFGSISACFLIICCVGILVFGHVGGNVFYNAKTVSMFLIYIMVIIAIYATFGCVRGFDYRYTLFNVAVWPILYILLVNNDGEV